MKRLLLVAACFAAAALVGCQKEEKAVPEAPSAKVEGNAVVFPAESPERQSLNVEAAQLEKVSVSHLTGRLYWDDDVTVRIFTPVAGRVTAIQADIGQSVEAGSPLAQIDSPDFGQARADARTAYATLTAAEKGYARSQDLMTHGAAAQKDVENAEAAYLAAVAARDNCRARLARYGGDENGTNEIYALRSPIGGTVVERNINPGQEVRADQMLANAPNLFAPLFVVSDPTRLWLQLDVSESDIAAVRSGQRLRIHSSAFPETAFDGMVENIGAEMDPVTRTVRVRCSVSNPSQQLKAEMYVLVDALSAPGTPGHAAVEVPARAVFKRGGQDFVFIEEAPGRYLRQAVKPGPQQDGKEPIFEGIQAGQKVVTDGCLLLEALLEAANQS